MYIPYEIKFVTVDCYRLFSGTSSEPTYHIGKS